MNSDVVILGAGLMGRLLALSLARRGTRVQLFDAHGPEATHSAARAAAAMLAPLAESAITALTAQNTVGVQAIHAVPPEFLRAQLQSVLGDIGADAVKIGMLHTPEVVRTVAWAIEHFGLQRVVLDPVMVATSGDRLIAEETVDVLVRELFPRCTVVTPNLDEAALLIGHPIEGAQALEDAGQNLLAMGARAALVKGGHLAGDEVVDLLVRPQAASLRLASPRIPSRNVHGTGCTLSSAMAAFLAQGLGLDEAVQHARTYILRAIAEGAEVKTGEGHGPLNHAHAPVSMHRVALG